MVLYTIWKFKLEITDEQILEMPKGAIFTSVDKIAEPTQHSRFDREDRLYLWAIVDSEARKENRTIYIYGTGQPLRPVHKNKKDFIGTVVTEGGQLIWHVFHDGKY